MRTLSLFLICLALTGCEKTEPKTGAMPGLANGGYDAPSNAEAAAAYMGGFQARYDIPELDYPQEIKDRIQKARREKFTKQMRKAQKRQELMAKLALTAMAQTDPEAKKLLKDLKENPQKTPDSDSLNQLLEMAEQPSQRQRPSKSNRQKYYAKAVNQYSTVFKSINIESCRWTEMTRLIGSGHEQMALIHGHHPTHGFRCVVDLTLEKNRGYPRTISHKAFWVKSQSGDWKYYGTFKGVDVTPRLQQLNQALLRDPEGTIKRQSVFDIIGGSLQ